MSLAGWADLLGTAAPSRRDDVRAVGAICLGKCQRMTVLD